MTETEYLQYALHQAQKLSELLKKAYDAHDHESDLHGGVALSAAKLSAQALEQELLSVLMTLKSS